MKKKVSIIIPYKEDRGYLDSALQSVERQIYTNHEVIISQSNNLVGYNLNEGIKKATGDYIVYLCDDDLLPPLSLSNRVNAMRDNDFIHSNGLSFFWNSRVEQWLLTDSNVTLERMVNKNCIMGGTTMYKRELFDEFQFDEELWTAEEYDFHMMLLQNNKKLGYLDAVTYLYRRHDKQKSLGKHPREYKKKRRQEIQRIANKYK